MTTKNLKKGFSTKMGLSPRGSDSNASMRTKKIKKAKRVHGINTTSSVIIGVSNNLSQQATDSPT